MGAKRKLKRNLRKQMLWTLTKVDLRKKYSIIFAAIEAAGGRLELDNDVLNMSPGGRAYKYVHEDGRTFIEMEDA